MNLIIPNAPPKTYSKIDPISGMSFKKETEDSAVPRITNTCQKIKATKIPGTNY